MTPTHESWLKFPKFLKIKKKIAEIGLSPTIGRSQIKFPKISNFRAKYFEKFFSENYFWKFFRIFLIFRKLFCDEPSGKNEPIKGDRGIGCQDMVLIEKMSENEIIENLRTRNRF